MQVWRACILVTGEGCKSTSKPHPQQLPVTNCHNAISASLQLNNETRPLSAGLQKHFLPTEHEQSSTSLLSHI